MTQLDTINICEEELTVELATEITPLLEKHWIEIAHYPDIAFDPDWERYFMTQDAGRLCVITARKGRELVGYIVYFLNHNMHYKNSYQAVQDVLFVDPEHRNGTLGLKLLKTSETILTMKNVQVVYQHLKFDHDFSPMLRRLGYEDVDRIMAKRLD